VRDDNRDAAALTYPRDCLRQCVLALGVEVRVRLVQYNQEWLTVERPRQRDPLTLPARKRQATFPDAGIIALRQRCDQLMYASLLGGSDDCDGIRIGLEAGDILGNRAFEQLQVLRQIPEMTAQSLGCH